MSAGDRRSLEMPAPTAAPLVAAFGLSLLAAGLVTHVSVSCVGALLALAGAVGWWREVLPAPHEEAVDLPAGAAAEAVHAQAAPARRAGPAAGEGGHRVRLPVSVHPLSAGAVGGLAGGAAMALVACTYGVLTQGSVWYPINLVAAAALPALAAASTEELRGFDAAALGIATLAHGALSVLLGVLYAAILPMLPRRHLLWGALVAPLLWTGVVWALVGLVDPVLAARLDWTWFVASQLAFGVATGVVVARARPVATAQTWAPAGPAARRAPPPEGGA